jgi:hypothetical protein
VLPSACRGKPADGNHLLLKTMHTDSVIGVLLVIGVLSSTY